MAYLPQLMLTPYRDGYSFALGRSTVSTQYISGMPRQRKTKVGTVHQLTATYKCTRSKYQYLVAFLRAYEAKPFLAYLLLDDIDHHWHECRIMDESIAVSTNGDQIFTVSLNLVVKSKKLDVGVDAAYLWAYSQTNGDISVYFNALEKLVNEDLPDAMREL